jgi:hypothetical protein
MSVAMGDLQDGQLRSAQGDARFPSTGCGEQYSCPLRAAVKRLLGEDLHLPSGPVPAPRSGVSPGGFLDRQKSHTTLNVTPRRAVVLRTHVLGIEL